MDTSLHLDTPLSRAVLTFFSNIEKDLMKEVADPGAVKAYLFGGCALHIHTSARGSNDIDVEFSAAKQVSEKDIIVRKKAISYYNGRVRRELVFDGNFTPTLGPLHEDYQDDAIQLQKHMINSPLWIYVVKPEDLAVSKLGRYSSQDRDDILTLLEKEKMTADSFYKRANEAISYYIGNQAEVKSHLDQVMNLYKSP